VQATVHRYDPHTSSGTVLTDHGVLVPFGPEALAGSGLRHLRSGQRLTVVVGADPTAGPETRVLSMRLGTVGRIGT
jgi:2-phospho-L-lactate guanylyltransferase